MQKSSTYNEPSVFGSKQFTMLFILKLNRVVERMLPWGTPCACSNWSDKVDPTRTCIRRSARKLFIKTGNLPFSPSSCKSRKMPHLQAASQALSKSKKKAKKCSPFTKASRTKASSPIKPSLAPRSDRKPDRTGDTKLFDYQVPNESSIDHSVQRPTETIRKSHWSTTRRLRMTPSRSRNRHDSR